MIKFLMNRPVGKQ